MNRRIVMPLATAVMATSALATPVVASGEQAEEAGVSQTITGEVHIIYGASGRPGYYLLLPDGSRVALRYGPPWFWGPLSPLTALAGETVQIAGHVIDGDPDEHAAATAQERAAREPTLHVKTVDEVALREKGKPPWAGGPKVVGEAHPGYGGGSHGQAGHGKAHKPDKAHDTD